MRHPVPLGAAVLLVLVSAATAADSIWARREPRIAFLFEDTRARHVGDLLTVTVLESTGVTNSDKRDLSKAAGFTDQISLTGAAALGKIFTRSGSGNYQGGGSSSRTFDGSAALSSARTFTDSVPVTVIDVLPNGNLIVEGSRQREVSGELRTLRITGIVRPVDIDAVNNVPSTVVGDFHITYQGRGIESDVVQPGYLKRLLFRIWPN